MTQKVYIESAEYAEPRLKDAIHGFLDTLIVPTCRQVMGLSSSDSDQKPLNMGVVDPFARF